MKHLTLFLFGCSSSIHYPQSTFSWDGRNFNRLIADRSIKHKKGDYGCNVQGQFDLSLNTLSNDKIEGLLLDNRNKEPITFVTVAVSQEGNSYHLSVVTKSNGKFKFKGLLTTDGIVIEYVGFNALNVKLDKMKK